MHTYAQVRQLDTGACLRLFLDVRRMLHDSVVNTRQQAPAEHTPADEAVFMWSLDQERNTAAQLSIQLLKVNSRLLKQILSLSAV